MKNSLVSIFLFIAALIIILVGIYAARNLIYNNQNKALIMQIKKINKSIEAFSAKYHALPGDTDKTISFGLSPYNSDGNMDNLITDIYNGYQMAQGEIVNFWMHLSNSQIINEKYDGMEKDLARTGFTFPESAIGNAGIVAFSYIDKTYLQIGYSHSDNKRIFTKNNVLTPQESYLFDKKIDDGHPFKGQIIIAGGDELNYLQNSLCANNNEYNIQTSKPLCQLRIEIK